MLDPEVAIDRLSAAYGSPAAKHRALHAKGHVYVGRFTPSAEARELCRAALLQDDEVEVVVRWSNGAGKIGSDRSQDVRGMAVKFRTSAGDTDLLGQTAPRFPVRTPEDFVSMTEAARDPKRMVLWVARHPNALPALAANTRAKSVVPPPSYAAAAYFPIHAYGWRDANDDLRWVRFSFEPLAPATKAADVPAGRDRLQEEMVARLAVGPVRYDVHATVAAPGDDPDDPMSVWRGQRELRAGTLEVTGLLEDQSVGEALVFDPTRVIEGIELPDDPILHYRRDAYSVSIARRTRP